LPCESGAEKPAKPALTPHTSVPRCFTVSSVPADATDSDATSTLPARKNLFMLLLPPY
jgi:hypothetical protein